jgi:mannose/fructose/N-acetylgalactosamine-specific phosphotransferase system component IIC
MDKVNTTQLLMSAVGTLGAVCAVLYTQLRATDKRQQAELDACKKECADDRARF